LFPRFDSGKALLVVIDVQGALAEAMSGKEALFSNLEKLIKGAKILGMPVVWTEQVPQKLGPTIERLSPLMEGEPAIAKSCFSCAADDHFIKAISATGKGQVLLCGIEAHICIFQTALDLMERKYEVFVAADAISSREEANRRIAVKRMRQCGAVIVSAEMALFEAMRDAKHPKFRDIQKIVK